MRLHAPPAWVLLLGLVPALGCGPIGPLPGGRLSGSVSGAVEDWSFVDDVETVQLETRPDDPHSVNTWIGRLGGTLYLPTSLILGADDPEERTWVRNALADPRVRVRIDGTLYGFEATRVDDPDEREAARAMLLAKYDVESDDHATRAWIFRLSPR